MNNTVEQTDFDIFEEYSKTKPLNQELVEIYNSTLTDYKFKLNQGDIVEGIVKQITNEYISVDINYREYLYIINKNEDQSDLQAIIENGIEQGIKLIVTKIGEVSSKTFSLLGSYTKFNNWNKFQQIIDSVGDSTVAYTGYVKSIIPNAGYIVTVDDFETFMPGSQASMNKLADPSILLHTEIPIMLVNYTKSNNTLISSHKAFLNKMIPTEINKLTTTEEYSGKITGFSKYGIFVEFNGCLTGLIYKTNIDSNLIEAFNSRTLNIGTDINFKILEIVNNKRIILTQNEYVDPWKKINEYKVDYTYRCKVVGKKEYGYFIELEPNLIGLYTCNVNSIILTIGQTVDLKIAKIDKQKHKISLVKK